MLKMLHQFQHFDFHEFSRGKTYMVTNVTEWNDYNTKERLGTKVEVAIIKDETEYRQKNGAKASNLFEKIVFKIARDGIDVPIRSLVEPVDAIATIYGDYGNQLSVKAKDIKILKPAAAQH